MARLFLTAMMLIASLHSVVGLLGAAIPEANSPVYPMTLLLAGQGNNGDNIIPFDAPRVAGYDPSSDTYICLYQQGDGNFRVLRSASPNDCENNVGDKLFHSRFSLPLENNEKYYTKLQVDGNLVTRKQVSDDWVWKTKSSQGDIVEIFSLVLNDDDTLSICDKDGNTIWNSATNETAYFNRPLALMTTWPDHPSRAWFVRPLKIPDRLTDSYVCVVQQGDGNFRVIRGDDCEQNLGSLIFHSGLSMPLTNNEKYWTHLQRDGNLVTRHELTKKWAWATCSGLGDTVLEDFELVLTARDTLAILDMNGTQVWESAQDESCFANE